MTKKSDAPAVRFILKNDGKSWANGTFSCYLGFFGNEELNVHMEHLSTSHLRE